MIFFCSIGFAHALWAEPLSDVYWPSSRLERQCAQFLKNLPEGEKRAATRFLRIILPKSEKNEYPTKAIHHLRDFLPYYLAKFRSEASLDLKNILFEWKARLRSKRPPINRVFIEPSIPESSASAATFLPQILEQWHLGSADIYLGRIEDLFNILRKMGSRRGDVTRLKRQFQNILNSKKDDPVYEKMMAEVRASLSHPERNEVLAVLSPGIDIEASGWVNSCMQARPTEQLQFRFRGPLGLGLVGRPIRTTEERAIFLEILFHEFLHFADMFHVAAFAAQRKFYEKAQKFVPYIYDSYFKSSGELSRRGTQYLELRSNAFDYKVLREAAGPSFASRQSGRIMNYLLKYFSEDEVIRFHLKSLDIAEKIGLQWREEIDRATVKAYEIFNAEQ